MLAEELHNGGVILGRYMVGQLHSDRKSTLQLFISFKVK
jgi:hypothetical protein